MSDELLPCKICNKKPIMLSIFADNYAFRYVCSIDDLIFESISPSEKRSIGYDTFGTKYYNSEIDALKEWNARNEKNNPFLENNNE